MSFCFPKEFSSRTSSSMLIWVAYLQPQGDISSSAGSSQEVPRIEDGDSKATPQHLCLFPGWEKAYSDANTLKLSTVNRKSCQDWSKPCIAKIQGTYFQGKEVLERLVILLDCESINYIFTKGQCTVRNFILQLRLWLRLDKSKWLAETFQF